MYHIIVYNIDYESASNLMYGVEERFAYETKTAHFVEVPTGRNSIVLIQTSDKRFNYSHWQEQHVVKLALLKTLARGNAESSLHLLDMDYYVTDNDKLADQLLHYLIAE